MKNNTILLDTLNEAQRQAVTAPIYHQLVLAGAGSGKTRVLAHRIAWLIQEEGFSSGDILAVTFTNKAASEMRSRIGQLLQESSRNMSIGTFHGLAHRFLRQHWFEANLPQAFQIIDSDDQLRLIRRTIQQLGLDEDRYPAKKAQWFINTKKDEGLEVKHLDASKEDKIWVHIYRAYEEACQRAGLVDFSDLLLKVHQLWTRHPAILEQYQQQYKYILVDEFQDTNAIQYAWIHLLAGKNNHVMIVGDEDQSIYGWRGAKVENIQRFCRDFPDALTIRLEQNYRSTNTILKAANALIENNTNRLGKNLWTSGDKGELITVYAAINDFDEARFLVTQIHRWQQAGNALKDIAILYRSNALSRIIEERLMQMNIAYRVYGGLRYFERVEIKDALAYLKLIVNPNDDAAFERIVNTPTRGIGDKTILSLREYAAAHQLSLWDAAKIHLDEKLLTSRAANALAIFIEKIQYLTDEIQPLLLHKQIEYVIQHSGLIEHYQKEKGEKGMARIENLMELVNAAREFVSHDDSPLQQFLSHTALETSHEINDGTEDAVQLMTLHSAKGLEFPVVFLCGFEEGIFPHYMTQNEPKSIEEERRLCYVGMTRAMQKLYMSYAKVRRMHGKDTPHYPSRFLREIPKQHVEESHMKTTVSRPSYNKLVDEAPFHIGQRVNHMIFGEGIILQYEGASNQMRIQVRFEKVGTKWLMASFITA